MWPYNDHGEDDYYKAIKYVENYAVSLGAKYVCEKEQKFTTISGDRTIVEELKMKIFKYGDEYFWIEHHFLPDRPFIVFSFGDTNESITDDADPFPYDLDEKELRAEVRYSLGIEKNEGVE